jgi:hypothetical protein
VQLARLGIRAGIMRERNWRQLYIKGTTPEEAAGIAQTYAYDARPTL